jgi:2-dehydropantoate 2-reductase
MDPDQDRSPSLLIVGTGAMACLFAYRLSAAGILVIMLGSWQAGLEAIEKYGVRVVDEKGQETAHPVRVTANPKDCANSRYALVLVKSWRTRRATDQLAKCLTAEGLALTLQNGAGNRDVLAKVLGVSRVTLGVTTAGATLIGPGLVRPSGEAVITLSAHPRLAALSNLLQSAGFVIETSPDATALLWGKLVINAAINPLTALLGVPNGELVKRAPARALLHAVVREAAAVAIAQGIRLPYPDPVIAVETIARRTSTNLSSMLQDVRRGAPTEIEAISGAIIQAGEQKGVPTPINRTLHQLVKALHPD